MTAASNSDARKREAERAEQVATGSKSALGAPNSPEMGSDASGAENAILSPEQAELISDMAGCGCCSSKYGIDKVWPDACPRDESGYVEHSYRDDCNQMMPLEDFVERIVREHRAEALAEVERRIERLPWFVFDDEDVEPEWEFVRRAEVRATIRDYRQEQNHG